MGVRPRRRKAQRDHLGDHQQKRRQVLDPRGSVRKPRRDDPQRCGHAQVTGRLLRAGPPWRMLWAMAHVFEAAPTGRAKCRGCNQAIAKGEIRFGERMPNAFGEGEMTLWFHPLCAAYKRPEALLEGLAASPEAALDREALERAAHASMAQRRLPRVDGAERSPSSQAKCRHCREPIEKGTWRIRLVFYEEGRFSPGGFIHLSCRKEYFEGHEVLEPALHFSPKLDEDARRELKQEYEASPG